MKDISILGRIITLHQRTKSQLKGINIGELLSFDFFDGEYLGVSMLFIQPKRNNPTPKECEITNRRLSELFGLPIVFVLESGPSYERQRLIDKGVFFVMGDKFAVLPMLVVNERIRQSRPAKRLSLVAQYMLLYHLQVESIEGMSARDLEGKLPYSYASITLGLTCLEDLGLCQKISDGAKSKIVHFEEHGRDLWNKTQDLFTDPVEKRIFCDGLHSDETYTICSINALSHYSRLNPDTTRMIMMSKAHYQNLVKQKALLNPNEFDGNIMIEIWKYFPVAAIDSKKEWVDKLSLVLSLREDYDARVEGEVERLMHDIEWKG